MAYSFTSWEELIRPDELEHHGIPGMRWHQRRYQNEDGSLTAAGRERYGSGNGEGHKKTSARKMQRDLNNLDKGFANVAAENAAANKRTMKTLNKMTKYSMKKGYIGKDKKTSSKELKRIMDGDKKLQKMGLKLKKRRGEVKLTEQQMKGIENLQWRIMSKAHDSGYTTSSKAVYRRGTTKRGRGIANAAGLLLGGGAIGGAAIGAALGASSKTIQGQKFKVRKNGDGSTRIVNYNTGSQKRHKRR